MENSDKNSDSGNGTKSSSDKSRPHQQTNNVEQMLKATRFSCTKVEAGFPAEAARAGFGKSGSAPKKSGSPPKKSGSSPKKSGSFSGRTKFEQLTVDGNIKLARRGIMKPSKEYVCTDDDI